jgi:hypothetical protein
MYFWMVLLLHEISNFRSLPRIRLPSWVWRAPHPIIDLLGSFGEECKWFPGIFAVSFVNLLKCIARIYDKDHDASAEAYPIE